MSTLRHLVLIALLLAGAVPADAAVSVTGTDPHYLFSAERYAVLRRMRAEAHPWYVNLKRVADATGTPHQAYGDYGQAAAIIYQVEGDPAYAVKAHTEFLKQFVRPYNGYVCRIYAAQIAVLTDWIWGGLDAARRTSLMDDLNEIADAIQQPHANGGDGGGMSLGDSDEDVGELLGVMLIDLLPQNPRRLTRLGGTIQDARSAIHRPIGGLDSTGADSTTWRNYLTWFATHWARGGAWFESSEYDTDTVYEMMFGVLAIESVSPGHFGDLLGFGCDAGMLEVYSATPDLRSRHQWGDVERPRNLNGHMTMYVSALMACAAAQRHVGDARAPYLSGVIAELVAMYGSSGHGSAVPTPVALLLHDPYAAVADVRSLPPSFYADGQGLLLHRDHSRNNLVAMHRMLRTDIDHCVLSFGDLQYYREGEWILQHPVGYTVLDGSNHVMNSALVAGLGMQHEHQDSLAHEADAGFAFAAMATYGRFYDAASYAAPPEFMHEWTRSQVYLAGGDGSADALVVFDRIDATDPRTLQDDAGLRRSYNGNEYRAIVDAPALKRWFWHTPDRAVVPSVTGRRANWTTATGQVAQLHVLEPSDARLTVVDEEALWGAYALWPLAWHVEVRPAADRRWDTGLTVLTARDAAAAQPLVEPVTSSAGEAAQGAVVRRAGLPDALVLFGAVPTALQWRLTSGTTITWTQGAPTGVVHAVTLDPAVAWTVRLDSAAAVPLRVSAEGVAKIPVTGAGAHTLQLLGDGSRPGNLPPVARIAIDRSGGPAPLTVQLDGSGSTDADGTITGYAWAFSDGGAAVGANASHSFATDGSYTVTLTVTDDLGARSSATVRVSAGGRSVDDGTPGGTGGAATGGGGSQSGCGLGALAALVLLLGGMARTRRSGSRPC